MSKYQNRYRIESTRLKGWDYGRNGSYFVTICTKNRKEYFGEIIESSYGNILAPTVIGKLAIENWYKIPQIFPFIRLDEFTLMPNHLHGIITIAKSLKQSEPVETHEHASQEDGDVKDVETHKHASHGDEGVTHVETHENASLPNKRVNDMETHKHAFTKDECAENDETHIDASLPSPTGVAGETHIYASLQDSELLEFSAAYENKFGPQSKNLSSVLRGYKGSVKAFATTNKIEFNWQERFYDHIIRDEKELEFIRDYIRNNPKNWKRDRNNEEGLYF